MTQSCETRGSNLEILVNDKGDMLVLRSGKQVIGFPSYRPQEPYQPEGGLEVLQRDLASLEASKPTPDLLGC